MTEAKVIVFPDALAFEKWLDKNVALQAGVWLKLAKKGSGILSLTSDEAVDIGLCYGWISGQRKPLDDTYYLQKYVPRRARSLWSRVNVDKVSELTAAGRMRAEGIAEVDAAKADGRWAAAYASQRNAEVPRDLEEVFAENPGARARFEGLGKAERYQVILKLLTARTEKGRAARLRKAVDALNG